MCRVSRAVLKLLCISQDSGKDKFSPQCECTVLTDLSVDSIYIPNSRGVSPIQSDGELAG